MYLDDTLTEQELSDANREMRGEATTASVRHHVHGNGAQAIDALRPYAASYATLTRWSRELVNWFSVSAGNVTAWRVGPDDYIIHTEPRQ